MKINSNKNSIPKKIERTGERDCIIRHDDGSIFECKAQNKHTLDNVIKSKYSIISHGIGEKKPFICDSCKKEAYRLSYREGKYLCESCQ